MIRRPCIFKSLQKTTQNFIRCGLRILAILAITLPLIGANPSGSAQASPAKDEDLEFTMTAVPSATYVCVGQSMDIKVTISRRLVSQPGDTGPKFGNIQGITPNVKPVDPGVGTIAISETIPSPTNLHMETTVYTFKASQNPGKTTIQFYADIPDWYIGNVHWYAPGFEYNVKRDLLIDVRNCTYKVNMLQLLSMAGVMQVTGVADQNLLRVDSDTHFSSVTSLKTTTQILIPDPTCAILGGHVPGGFSLKIESTTVEYTIDVAGDRLYFNAVIAPYTVTSTDLCSGKSFTFPMGGSNPQPFLLPAVGGVITKRSIIASTTFIVERVAVP